MCDRTTNEIHEPPPSPPQDTDRHLALARWHRAAIAALPAHAAAQALLSDSGCADVSVQTAWQLGTPDPSCAHNLSVDDEQHLQALGIPTSGSGWSSMLRSGGIIIPTFLPTDPTRIVGVARLAPAQRKHAMLTTPALGFGGSAAALASPCPILAVGIPLALRLAGLGVREVLLVENTAVLAASADTLRGRRVRLLASKQADVNAFSALLKKSDLAFETLLMPAGLYGLSPRTAEWLGIDVARLPQPAAIPPRTPTLLRDVVAFAQARIADGHGRDALEMAGLHHIDLITTYGIGYLPPDYQVALDRSSRRAFAGTRLGGSLIMPATNEHGHVVDGLVIYQGAARFDRPLATTPSGILGGALITAHAELVVTDTLAWLARLWRMGYRNVLFLRGVADLERNRERFISSGVQQVTLHLRQHYERAADILRAVGLRVLRGAEILDHSTAELSPSTSPSPDLSEPDDHEPVVIIDEDESPNGTQLFKVDSNTHAQEIATGVKPFEPAPVDVASSKLIAFPPAISPPAQPITASKTLATPISSTSAALPLLTLVDQDATQGLATFTAGPVTYAVQLPWDASTRLVVTLRAAGKICRDTFDVAVDAQRRRFAANAGVTVGITSQVLLQQLTALDQAVAGLRRVAESPVPIGQSLSAAEQAEAMAALRSPDLLDRLLADLTALGCVGEDQQKRALLLCALSRKLDEPVWASYQAAPGIGGCDLLDTIAAMTPPEDVIAVSRLSGAALYQAEPNSLRHRLLLIADAQAITDEVAVALRILRNRGALSATQMNRSTPSGRTGIAIHEVRGPLQVLVGTSFQDHALADTCWRIVADDSSAQTADVLSAQRQRYAEVRHAQSAKRTAICGRVHNLQRLLACRAVVIPFAKRIHFPARSLQHRREQGFLLGLIAASALLHQYQRLSEHEAIIADERDFIIAQQIAVALGVGGDDELSGNATQLLRAWWASGTTTATMAELTVLMPNWTRHAFRTALPELITLEYVAQATGGRGKARTYHLIGARAAETTTNNAARIWLQPTDATATTNTTERDSHLGELAELGEDDLTKFTRGAAMA